MNHANPLLIPSPVSSVGSAVRTTQSCKGWHNKAKGKAKRRPGRITPPTIQPRKGDE